jgi:NDP-sugar pyrophosphorylase family protein
VSEIVGIVPAAGHATRLQPLDRSKEVLHIGGKPVMDHLVERMRRGGCTRLRVVTRPDKLDVIAHAERLGAQVVLATPASVSASFLAGMRGLASDDVVLIGFPDTLWEPVDGYEPLVRAVGAGCDVALGLFRIREEDLSRSDVVEVDEDGRVASIHVKPAEPPSPWIWGCAAARTEMMLGLERAEWPGGYIDLLCREGRDVRGFPLSDTWLDVGTRSALDEALRRYGSVKREGP